MVWCNTFGLKQGCGAILLGVVLKQGCGAIHLGLNKGVVHYFWLSKSVVQYFWT